MGKVGGRLIVIRLDICGQISRRQRGELTLWPIETVGIVTNRTLRPAGCTLPERGCRIGFAGSQSLP